MKHDSERVARVVSVITRLESKELVPTKTRIMQWTGWLKGPTQEILDYMVEMEILIKTRIKRSYKEAYSYTVDCHALYFTIGQGEVNEK